MHNMLQGGRAKTFCDLVLTFWLIGALATFQSTAQVSSKRASPSQFKLVGIQVTGNTHYSSEQIVALTGLQLGQSVSDNGKTVNEDIFREAAKRVGDTGVFHDVSYRYEYSATGTKLDLQVSEGGKFVRAVFDNFVWFTDDELLSNLKSQIPMFDGNLPASGTIPDRIADVLQRMLDDRKVSGTVEFIPAGRQGGRLDEMKYQVSGIPIRIHEMSFPGAGPAEIPLLQSAAQPLQGHAYSRSMLSIQEEKTFLPVFLAHGYLKAKFADSKADVASGDQEATNVDVELPVATGLQYKLQDFNWTGNTVFPADKLQSLIHVRPGIQVNAVQLGEDMQAVRDLYGTLGYIAARVIPSPVFDDASSSVRYTLEVKEGDQFRMGKLEVEGLDAPVTQAVIAAWKIKIGDPFDNGYEKRYLNDLVKAHVRLPTGLKVKIEQKVNPPEKTVDVKMIFSSDTSP